MPRLTFPVLVLLALWLLPACRTVPNAAYCDSDEDCEAQHGAGWTCDDSHHACQPPSGAGCSDDEECMRVDEPICDLAANPSVCSGCTSNEQCTNKDSGTPFCNLSSGACMAIMPPACTDSDDCTASATAPICDTVADECKSCNDAGGDAACELRDSGSAPYCVTEGAAAGACAACLDNAHCTADAPVCGAAGTCGACKEHSDCAAFSGVCDAGACADESEVVYVQQMNSADTNDCSKAAPCTTINRGLAAVAADNQNKLFIRILDGANYSENVTMSGVTASIIGNDGTRITGGIDSQPAITVGAATSLTLDTLIIRSTGNNADGIACNGSTLRLESAAIRNNNNLGIASTNCDLTIERSRISANAGGGIQVNNSNFQIVNNYIMDNGSGSTAFGGIQILNGLMEETQVLAFNTILNNSAAGSADSRGVHCTFPAASPLTATSNIVRGGTGGTALLKRDNCDWVHSDIEDLPADLMVAEKNNIDDDCTVTPGADELPRIDAASMCKEGGEPGTGIDIDYDGDARPDGSGADKPDIGADEIVAAP